MSGIVLLLLSAGVTDAQSALLAATRASASTSKSPSHIELRAMLHSGGDVDLSWATQDQNVAEFRIERSPHGEDQWLDIADLPADDSTYDDPRVKTTLIDYRVEAVDKQGNPLDVSAAVSPSRINLVDIINGSVVKLSDFEDFTFWQASVNNIVLGTLAFIPKLIAAVILFGIFWVFYRLVRRIILSSMARAHVDSSIRDMLGALLRWSIMGFALVIACDQIGIQIAALLTGVSIIGLAIGFAAQETLANFIAGVVIFWDKPFKVGDWIVIDNMFGKVLRVSFRSTRMLNLSGETIVMPNTYMLANRVANHSTHPYVRVEIPISIAYKESIDAARSALLEMFHNDARICRDPAPSVVVTACAESSVDLLIWIWTHDEAVERNVYHEYLEKAKKALDAAHIEIPFPHMQLLLNGHSAPAVMGLGAEAIQTRA